MKIILLRRKLLAVLACVLAAAAMFYIVNYPEVVSAAATKRQLPIYCVQRDQKMVAISFDAAWGDVRQRRRSSDVRTQLRGVPNRHSPSACQKSPPARSSVIRR